MSLRAVGLPLAVAAAVVHGALAVASPSAVALAMLPLAVGCLLCARHLDRTRAWAGCAVLDAAMLGLMLLEHAAGTTGPASGTAHHGGHAVSLLPGAAAAAGEWAHGLMSLAEGLVVTQLALAGVVLLSSLPRRSRKPRTPVCARLP